MSTEVARLGDGGAQIQRLEPVGEGCVLVGSTNNPTMYAQEWLANVSIPFRVEGGPELRAAMATLVTRLTAALETLPE